MKARRSPQGVVAGLLLILISLVALSPAISGCDGDAPAQPPDSQAAVPPDSRTAPVSASTFETLAFPASMPQPAWTAHVPVLMYHHAGDPPPHADKIRLGLTVSAADLDGQMGYLKDAGFHPISQMQLFKAMYFGVALPEKPVMITFDDGYQDNFTVALPILKKYGFPACFYIITDKVGTVEYMNWDQIVELERAGMEIGSHTVDHQDLSIIPAAAVKHELTDSAQALTSHLGHAIYWLCYPSGKFNPGVVAAAREAGYLMAVTVKSGDIQSSDTPYTLSRYRIRNDTGLAGFKEIVS